ncbi:MAG: hypothetical protein R2877_04065 [Bdellovibrionota bacterium]
MTHTSHELKIPDQAKAIEVEIRACLGPVIHNSIQFQGPQVSFIHYETALSKTMGMAQNPDPVGFAKLCGIEGLNNKVEVKWKPVTGTSVTIKNIPHKVVPFTNGAEITRKYGFPVAAPFGVPFELRDEINLNQSAWVQSKVRTSVNTTVVNNFQYLNNDTGLGHSYVHIFPMLHWAPVVISMVLFVEDAAVAQ